MSEVHGLAEAQRVVGSFRWHEPSTLRRLCLHALPNGTGCFLELDLEAADTTPRFGLTVRFDGVQRLRLSELTYPEIRISGFYINNIADRQWERLHWEIGDYEGNDLHFYCDSVSILSVSRLDTGERSEIG